MSEGKSLDIRAVVKGEILDEYLFLKKKIGTLSEPETIRVIIHQYYQYIKDKESIYSTD